MSKPRILYGGIAWRSLEDAHVAARDRLFSHPDAAGRIGQWRRVGDADVARARSILATRFLKEEDFAVLLSVDTDIDFRAEDALQVCDQAVDYGIVAGVYPVRSVERCVPATHFADDTLAIIGGDDPTPVPVLWPAGGFVAVHRRVFEAVREHAELPLLNATSPPAFYPFYQPFWVTHEQEGAIWLSEDWAWAERARRAGFPSYINPAVRLTHYGVYPYQIEDMLRPPLPQAPVAVRRVGRRYHAELREGRTIGR